MQRIVEEAGKIIADYFAAYEACHKKKPDFTLVYEMGWFVDPENRKFCRYRKAKLLAMTDTLTRMAKDSA